MHRSIISIHSLTSSDLTSLLRFQLLQLILPGAQAYLFGVIHRVPPMTAFNALDQGFAVVSGGRLDGVNEVRLIYVDDEE